MPSQVIDPRPVDIWRAWIARKKHSFPFVCVEPIRRVCKFIPTDAGRYVYGRADRDRLYRCMYRRRNWFNFCPCHPSIVVNLTIGAPESRLPKSLLHMRHLNIRELFDYTSALIRNIQTTVLREQLTYLNMFCKQAHESVTLFVTQAGIEPACKIGHQYDIIY
jgi:hypothetical protein